MEEVLDLYQGLLIPYMQVRRDIPFPAEPDRFETDGEHAFSLAMIAITIAHKMGLDLDSGKIAQYALVHDLVEAHAGDVSARASDAELKIKVDREHEAFLVIKERYSKSAPWIPELIEAYEARSDDEAKFVYSVDKQMGGYTWMSGSGIHWSKNYPSKDGSDYHNVYQRLRKKAEIYPATLDLFDEIHDELDERRLGYMK